MGKEKKKWYQTGEFEDGYQFGDIFRTVKNSISGKEEEVEKVKNITEKSGTSAQIPFAAVKDGRLSVDVPAQTFGWKNDAERARFKAEHPMEYAATGGVKLDTNVLSKNNIQLTTEQQNILEEARKKDEYIKSLQYKLDVINVKNIEKKRKNSHLIADSEIESELRIKWLNGVVNMDELATQLKKENDIYNAKIKFDNGDAISLNERLLLTENGGENYTEGNTNKIIDFLAQDNPENINARDTAEKARKKQKNNIPLTQEEKTDISNYETRRHIQKSILENKYALGSDIKKNKENMNTIAAISLYNDAIYDTGINKTFNQMQLYINTGFTRYFQDSINTAEIFLTEDAYHKGLTGNRGSNVIKNEPKSMYEIANSAVGEYFVQNDMKFNKFVQDTTVNLANNTIPMLLSGVSGGASMVASGLSVFGSSYREAVEMAPDVEEWRYWLYAGMNTSVELCMEKLLSGDKNIAANTGSEFTDAMFKMLTKNISNKMLLGGVYILSNSTGEFVEETIQGLLSPVMQELILGVDATSILSSNKNEQLNAMKNALYDGMVGFVSAGVTTGMFINSTIEGIEQRRIVGEYYNKLFNNLNIDSKNVALYLKEISNGEGIRLYKSAKKVLQGDTSNDAVANMMIDGFEQSLESQRFIYTKIGEQLNRNNRYIVYSLIKQYDKLSQSEIELSKSIHKTYNELINTSENTSRETFNYLVGKLSTTMDAVLPRTIMASEIKKKINADIKENQMKNNNSSIDEVAVVDGIWEDSPNKSKNVVEKGQLESVEKTKENGIIEKTKVLTLDDLTKDVLKTKPLYSPVPERWMQNGGIIEIANDGNWIYTNTDGISVKYVDGYPDFKGAGLVIQEVDVGEFVSREADKKKAKELVQQNPNTEWHHPANSNKLQEIDANIHKQFTHIGAISKNKKGD